MPTCQLKKCKIEEIDTNLIIKFKFNNLKKSSYSIKCSLKKWLIINNLKQNVKMQYINTKIENNILW